MGRAPSRGPFRQQTCKPDSVESNHLSGTGVTVGLLRPTWTWAGNLVAVLLGLAPGGVYL